MFYQRRKIPGIYYITYTISFILENATAQNRYTQDSLSEVGGLKVSPKNSCQLASHRVCLSATLSITFYHFNNLEGFELTHLAMLDICPHTDISVKIILRWSSEMWDMKLDSWSTSQSVDCDIIFLLFCWTLKISRISYPSTASLHLSLKS